MEVQPDFKELLALFNKHDVDFLVVGGYALAFHGAPRFTGDIDLLVRPEIDNAKRIVLALEEFGFGSIGLNETDFTKPDHVIQLGKPPVRIDILTSISGLTWEQASKNRVAGNYGGAAVSFIGRVEFIANKRATGRMKDLADIEALGEPPFEE
ncbi:MAG: hypothetical protein ACI97A_004477 [Planctomycetota bacterium]|jgi:hypothetical protein